MKLLKNLAKAAQSITGGWHRLIHEPFAGAWQQGRELTREETGSFFAVFACATKIAQDISKMPTLAGENPPAVLRRPNHYQTLQQFLECWIHSKLFRGNTYIYLQHGIHGKIEAMYVLNPDLVKPLIDDDGTVYYEIETDRLNRQEKQIVPHQYILHDRWNCFYHPLVGLPPVMACAVAAGNGLAIQKHSRSFFRNRSVLSGILTAPGHIDKDKAKLLGERWNEAYSGENVGKTAVLGDGMAFQNITMSALDSQLIEQLRLSAEIVCSAFKIPPFLIGFGNLPAGMKVSDLHELYYSSCLQALLEAIENLLSGALGQTIEFDLDSLIRMDAFTRTEVLSANVGSALMTPNEARAKLGLPPVEGGDSPYLQQQNFSLSALARRDAGDNPFGKQNADPR